MSNTTNLLINPLTHVNNGTAHSNAAAAGEEWKCCSWKKGMGCGDAIEVT